MLPISKTKSPHLRGKSRRRASTKPPDAEEITRLRISLKLTQESAGAIVYATERAWQLWEAGDRRMHPATWELFKLKTEQTERPAQTDLSEIEELQETV